jgi:hypothetical protein
MGNKPRNNEVVESTRLAMQDAGWVRIEADVYGIYVAALDAPIRRMNWRDSATDLSSLIEPAIEDDKCGDKHG